jgi:RHS repeat-associated protein
MHIKKISGDVSMSAALDGANRVRGGARKLVLTALCSLTLLTSHLSATAQAVGSPAPDLALAKITAMADRLAPRPTLLPGQSATRLADGTWLLLGGGANSAASADAISIDASGKATKLSATMLAARHGQAAAILPDGTVLVHGGVDRSGAVLDTAEVFDPATGKFSALSGLGLLPRAHHAATVMADGRLLITGGLGRGGSPATDVEVFDPTLRHVERFNVQLDGPRLRHVAALLPDTNVLLWGGTDARGRLVEHGSLYDAGSQRFSAVTSEGADSKAAALTGAATPLVLATQPAANSTAVPVSQRLMVRFNKRMNVASLNAGTVTLMGPSGPVRIKPVAVEGGVLLFVTAAQELLPAASYTLFIQGALDEFGQALPLVAIGFKTTSLGGNAASAPGLATATISAASPRSDLAAANASQAKAAAAKAQAHVDSAAEDDDDSWVPTELNYRDNWRSGRQGAASRTLPRNPVVRWALHGDPAFAKLTLADIQAGRIPKGPRIATGVTALAGQVLRLNGLPLKGVTLSIGSKRAETDSNGEFTLEALPSGHQVVVIDGRTADHGERHYGRFEYGIDLREGELNALPFVAWMSRLDTRHSVKLASPTVGLTVLKTPAIPGFELRLPAGSVIRDDQGKIVTELSMTAIPVDQPPIPLPKAYPAPMYFTIQPGGAHLVGLDAKSAKGAQLIYPNFSNYPAGMRVDFLDYDPRGRGWFKYGSGTVTSDAKQVVPDAGVAIYEFTGAYFVAPSNPAVKAPVGPPPDGCKACDPVDVFTGLYINESIDMTVQDILPISIQRTFRQGDNAVRAFGIGSTLSYDIFLTGDPVNFVYADLILSDGGSVHFDRVSAGNAFSDAVFVSSSAVGSYHGAILVWDGVRGGWTLTLKDHTRMVFPMGDGNARAAALVAYTDRNGNTITMERDASANLTKISTASGRNIQLVYDTQNRVTQATDPLGRVVTYAYDASGRLSTFTDAAGNTEVYAYETFPVNPATSIGGVSSTHNMISVQDKRGKLKVVNLYDTNGRVIKQTYPDGRTSTLSYALTSITGVLNGVVQTYSIVSRADVTDERGTITRYALASNGYPTSVTRGLGLPEQQITVFVRDSVTNLLTSSTDALNRKTSYQYDTLGNVTKTTNLDGTAAAVATTFTYDPVLNLLNSTTDANNHTSLLTRDSLGNVTKVSDPLGHSTQIGYDSKGRVRTVQDALTHTAQLTYSGPDLSAMTDALNRTTALFTDGVGRVRSVRDPLGNPTYVNYDALDRAVSATDARGGVAARSYDGNGNVLSQTDQNIQSTAYTFDDRNRRLTQKDALNKQAQQTYEPGGNAAQVTDRKGQVSRTLYDGLGRPVSIGYGATTATPTTFKSTVALTWDGGDRLTKIVDSVSGTITRTYDGLDRLLTETTPQGAVTYTYDLAGRRKTMTVLGQPTVSYTWDDANRLTQISQAAGTSNANVVQTVTFAYDNANRRISTALPNGIVVAYAYDDASQLTGITYTTSSAVLIGTLTYGYDAAGRRTTVGGTLANVLPGTAVSATTFDVNNRLTKWGAQTLTYDANGNLLSDGSNTYTWDERDRLVKIVVSGSASTPLFKYDSLGRRISKTVGGVQTGYVYDGVNFVQEKSGSSVTANLITGLGADEWFARELSGNIRYPLSDALGSVIALTDTAQTTTTSYSYDAYGGTIRTGAVDTNSQQYTGRENDATGLYYYRARYYNPKLGRFISEDPIGWESGQTNGYLYVGGNPNRYTDPTGQFAMLLPFIPLITGTDLLIGAGLGGALIGLDKIFNKPPKDATDPNGAKAPGQPGAEEGFCGPKKGKPTWGRAPNGRGAGWIDSDGNVWVPTGPDSGSTGDAHGGPHWDVQKPGLISNLPQPAP